MLHIIGDWAFIQIIIIKRGLFWNMTYFYMRQTQRARKNIIIIVESLLTYLWALQALFWNIKIFTLFELSTKCEKVCFVCMLFLHSALQRGWRQRGMKHEYWNELVLLCMNPYKIEQLFSTSRKGRLSVLCILKRWRQKNRFFHFIIN